MGSLSPTHPDFLNENKLLVFPGLMSSGYTQSLIHFMVLRFQLFINFVSSVNYNLKVGCTCSLHLPVWQNTCEFSIVLNVFLSEYNCVCILIFRTTCFCLHWPKKG